MHRGIGMKDLLLGLGLISCPAIIFVVFGTSGLDAFDESASAPSISASVQLGGIAYAEECTGCHGRTARGTERGPNLIHADYGPARRSDAQFRRALSEGKLARRAGYEDMPPVKDRSERHLNRLVAFLRDVQRANGIR